MFEQLIADRLPTEKLLILIRDGPNVNKTIFRKLKELIKEDRNDFRGFVDLGSCILQIHQLCFDVYDIFQHSASRKENYAVLRREMGMVILNFRQQTEVRWLSLGPAIERLL